MQPPQARVLLAGAPAAPVVYEPLSPELADRDLATVGSVQSPPNHVALDDGEPLLSVPLPVEGLGGGPTLWPSCSPSIELVIPARTRAATSARPGSNLADTAADPRATLGEGDAGPTWRRREALPAAETCIACANQRAR